MSELRKAITRVHDSYGEASPDDVETTCQAALHYADMQVVLTEMFGPDAERELAAEVGRAVQKYVETEPEGIGDDIRDVGAAALAPVLARLNEALTADVEGRSR